MNFGTTVPEDESPRAGLLDRMEVPWQVSLGATATNTFVHNPVTEAVDSASLYLSQNDPFLDQDVQKAPAYDQAFGEFVDPKTLNDQYGSLGLHFDQPTRANAVGIMVRRKQEEIARQANIDRAPGGIAYGIANFGTQLAVSATDPLNVASAFMPVVSEARAAIWAAKFGKPAGRFLTGAVEGAAGAAAVEPLNYGASKYLGDDYDLGDSLINIALGSVLGGGLHAGFGAISDHLNRLTPETREATLRGAVANVAEGRGVQVDHIIGSDPTYRQFDQIPDVRDLTLQANEARLQAEHDALGARMDALPPGDAAAQERLARLSTVEDQLKDENLETVIRRQLSSRRDEILTDTTPERLQEAAAPIAERRNLESQQARLREEIGKVQKERADLALHAALTPPEIASVAKAAARRFREASTASEPRPDAVAAAQRDGSAALSQAADRQNAAALERARTASQAFARNAEPSSAVPPDTSANGDRVLREARGDDLDTEHKEALATVDAYEKQGVLTPEEAEQARSGGEDIQKAARNGKAAKIAANCLLLHP